MLLLFNDSHVFEKIRANNLPLFNHFHTLAEKPRGWRTLYLQQPANMSAKLLLLHS